LSFAQPFNIEGGIVDVGLSIVGIVAEEGVSCITNDCLRKYYEV